MKEMIKPVANAGSYAPVTGLVYERPDSVYLLSNRMASYLDPIETLALSPSLRNRI